VLGLLYKLLLAETVELLVDGVDDLDGDNRALRQVVHSVPFVGGSLYPVNYARIRVSIQMLYESVSVAFARNFPPGIFWN
jgi:hypothetical protein